MDIHIISSEIDGRQLRLEKNQHTKHVRCNGNADDRTINDVVTYRTNRVWFGLGESYNKIFGKKE